MHHYCLVGTSLAIAHLVCPVQAQCEVEIQRVQPEGATPGASIGFRVSVAGSTAVVGAPFDDGQGEDAGAVWVYEETQGSGWLERSKLTADDAAPGDLFGWAVKADGDCIAVGAPNANGRGAVSLFRRLEGGWALEQQVVSSSIVDGGLFGHALALQEDRLLVGAPHIGLELPGTGHVYERDPESGVWSETQRLRSPDPAFAYLFGYEVALGEGLALVTGGANPFTPAENAIFVYQEDPSGCLVQASKIFAPRSGATYFASDLAFDGETLVATAAGEVNLPGTMGAIYVFGRDSGGAASFEELERLESSLAPFGLFLPEAVAISGNWIVAGDPSAARGSGAVEVFGRRVGGANRYEELARILAPDSHPEGHFGLEVGLVGDTLLVGAPEEYGGRGTEPGAVYFVHLDNLAISRWRNDGEGNNPDVYRAARPFLGEALALSVDLTTTGYGEAMLIGSSMATELPLASGAVLLCDPSKGLFTTSPASGPHAQWEIPVPMSPELCGRAFSTQAVLVGGAGPFGLSNAQDLVLGVP